MRRQPQARGHKARYREEAFYELEKIAKQRIEERQVRLKANNVYIGSKIFECQYVSKKFPARNSSSQETEKAEGKVILDHFYYNFARFEKKSRRTARTTEEQPRKNKRGTRGGARMESGRQDDWRQFFQGHDIILKDDEPDFSEEGWARRKPKKKS
jgi:hypothetical protein